MHAASGLVSSSMELLHLHVVSLHLNRCSCTFTSIAICYFLAGKQAYRAPEAASQRSEATCICIQSAAAAASAAALCCYTAVVAAAAVLLLPAAVRHRLPEDQLWCWFIENDPSASFAHQTRFHFVLPLGSTVSHLRSRSPVIAGVHGAKASACHGECPL